MPILLLLLVLVLIGVGAGAAGFVAGWVAGRYHWPALSVIFAVLALVLALLGVAGVVETLAQAAEHVPQVAQAATRMQREILFLSVLLAGLTLWGSVRHPYWSAAALGLIFPVASVSASAFGISDVSATERLNLELEGRGDFALLLACAVGVWGLVGLGAGQARVQKQFGARQFGSRQ